MKNRLYQRLRLQVTLAIYGVLLPNVLNAQSLEQSVAYTFDTHPELRV
jgi:adhesin transport system outer membrane protein